MRSSPTPAPAVGRTVEGLQRDGRDAAGADRVPSGPHPTATSGIAVGDGVAAGRQREEVATMPATHPAYARFERVLKDVGRRHTLDPDNLDEYLRMFARVGGQGASILEVGSGTGLTCILFALLGAREVVGLELLPGEVALAEQFKAEIDPDLPVSFVVGDAAQPLPFPDGRFDAVLLVEVASHVVPTDLRTFFAEMLRVLRPGGTLYLADGNNARSPVTRLKNHRIWERFERGPATAPGETVFSHVVTVPYVEARRAIALAAEPGLSEAEATAIAERTFRYREAEVVAAARAYRATGALPDSPYRRGVCPIEPRSGSYIEELLDPFHIRRLLRQLGCDRVAITARRRLPLGQLWDALPRLTMRLSNGFLIVARKGHDGSAG
jgi:SAM-dependent methyltransferase